MHRRILSAWLLGGILVAAGLFGAIDLVRAIILELHAPPHGDSDIYFTVGRGILNGLTPYKDLFESKPPGIFIVTALSLAFGGTFFAQLLQALAYISIVAAPLVWAWCSFRSTPDRWLMTGIGGLTGLLFALFTALYAGQVQVESFGVAFALWYPVLLDLHGDHWRRRDTILASVIMFGSIGFKEPFVLPLFVCAILQSHDVRSFARMFLLPLGIAVIAGAIVLTMFGWLGSYLSIYLAFMLSSRGVTDSSPLWLRGFEWIPFFKHAWGFAPGYAILFPFLCLFLIGRVLMESTGTRTKVFFTVRVLLSAYLLALTVGIGVFYYHHHYVFVLPGVLALLIIGLQAVEGISQAARRLFLLCMVALLAMGIFLRTRIEYGALLIEAKEAGALHTNVAATLDRVMNSCGVDRYWHLVNKGGGPYGRTRHSPSGPAFILYTRFVFDPEHIAKHIDTDRIILMRDDESTFLSTEGMDYIRTKFSAEPWPCAGEDFAQPEPYTILFKSDDPNIQN